ncbi:MAG: hypothetical protein SX243_03850 [Acidobacteriota bacterium]|nr:hypothetical protein [Acidobacteriota bacterium]
MSYDRMISSLARKLEAGEPLEALTTGLSGAELQSLLLHVFRQRSRQRTPAELLRQYERVPMVQPAHPDPRALLEVEAAAFAAAEGFEGVELSPVAPLGINQVLGQIDQNNCLATIRSSEVLADPTTATALECARRRRAGEAGTIRLCSRSRQLRLQPLPPGAAWVPHFLLFSLVTAGRDRGSYAFEVEHLLDHLRVYVNLLVGLRAHGYTIGPLDVRLSDTERDSRRLALAERAVLGPLAEEFPQETFRLDPEREQAQNYYQGLCLGIYAADNSGDFHNMADGGFTDWTQRLLSNAKERLLVTALGLERLAMLFRPASG